MQAHELLIMRAAPVLHTRPPSHHGTVSPSPPSCAFAVSSVSDHIRPSLSSRVIIRSLLHRRSTIPDPVPTSNSYTSTKLWAVELLQPPLLVQPCSALEPGFAGTSQPLPCHSLTSPGTTSISPPRKRPAVAEQPFEQRKRFHLESSRSCSSSRRALQPPSSESAPCPQPCSPSRS